LREKAHSQFAISWFNFPVDMEKPSARGSFPESQGASRPETGSKSKTETATTPACEKNCHNRESHGQSLERNVHA